MISITSIAMRILFDKFKMGILSSFITQHFQNVIVLLQDLCLQSKVFYFLICELLVDFNRKYLNRKYLINLT